MKKHWQSIVMMGIFILMLIGVVASLHDHPQSQAPKPNIMTFTEFQKTMNEHPEAIKTVLYASNNPTMEVTMKDGKVYVVDSPMLPDYRMKLMEKGIEVELASPPSTSSALTLILTLLSTLMPIILISVIMFWFMKKQQGQTKLSYEFQKPSTREVTLQDVAGIDHARDDLQEIIEFLSSPAKFSKVGAKMPKGVLLMGPPGTGKTLLARAIAAEANVPFAAVSGSDFVEKYVGVGASRIRELFQEARKKSPSIIFIDEIDALAKERGGSGSSEYDHALNQLLVEMNGFTSRDGVVVIAATNRPDSLDSALKRPGRFDRQITVGLPDREARLQILRVHAAKRELTQDAKLQLESWARRTTFFSGADLENLMNEAAIRAIRNGHAAIEPEDFEQAYNKVIAGGEKRTQRQERDRVVTAWHEAGHAVLASYYGREVPRVTIVPQNNGAGGYTLINKEEKMQTKREMIEELSILMGGRAAEAICLGESEVTGGASHDLKRATEIAGVMAGQYGMGDLGLLSVVGWQYGQAPKGLQEGVERFLADAMKEATSVLTSHDDVLRRLAEALLTDETLSEEALSSYLKFDRAEKSQAA